mgnify:CR=1 FL=1
MSWSLAIPVTFGPHEADWLMVGLTAASVVASVIVAVFAYKNGAKATEIAKEAATIAKDASDRDEAHRALEVARRAESERSRVALAMLEALAAVERLSRKDLFNYADAFSTLQSSALAKHATALALIDVYERDADNTLHGWFERALGLVMEYANNDARARFAQAARATREGILNWQDRKPYAAVER